MMRSVLTGVLLYGFLMLPGCGGSGTVAVTEQLLIPKDSQLVVAGHAHGRVLVGSAPTTLTARLIGPDNAPLADLSIVAVAPDDGASGTFADPTPGAAHIARTLTDADGSVSFSFTPDGTPGSFLVELTVEGTPLSITFAITVVAAAPGSATTPEQARRLLSEDVIRDDSPAGYLVHGPFFLPAGTQVVTNLGDADDGVVFDVTVDSWFFWEDDEPAALFEHPVRYHLLDAAIAAPVAGDVMTVDGERWPELLYSGASRSVALLTPSRINAPTDLDEYGTPPEAQPVPMLAESEFRNECVIVVAGPVEASLRRNARHVGDFFRYDRKSLYIQQKIDDEPSTFEELKQMIQNAKDGGCPKLFLYITGHGYRTGAPSITLGRKDMPFERERVSYKRIADELEAAFGNSSRKVCVILETCFAERAILEFQNRGMEGEIAVSSVHDSLSWFDRSSISYFTQFLIDCWSEPAGSTADTDRDGDISLAEARAWVDVSRRPIAPGDARRWIDARKAGEDHGITSLNVCDVYVAAQRTQTHEINPSTAEWNTNGQVPDVELFAGTTVEIEVQRPAANSGLDRTPMDVSVSVQNPAIALIPGALPGSTFTLRVEANTLKLQVVGLVPGVTTYTVRGKGRRDVFAGSGTITVKAPSVKLDHALGTEPVGTEVSLQRISGGRVGMGSECDGLPHLHGTIFIDGQGPYNDPNPDGCGWGLVIGYQN